MKRLALMFLTIILFSCNKGQEKNEQNKRTIKEFKPLVDSTIADTGDATMDNGRVFTVEYHEDINNEEDYSYEEAIRNHYTTGFSDKYKVFQNEEMFEGLPSWSGDEENKRNYDKGYYAFRFFWTKPNYTGYMNNYIILSKIKMNHARTTEVVALLDITTGEQIILSVDKKYGDSNPQRIVNPDCWYLLDLTLDKFEVGQVINLVSKPQKISEGKYMLIPDIQFYKKLKEVEDAGYQNYHRQQTNPDGEELEWDDNDL